AAAAGERAQGGHVDRGPAAGGPRHRRSALLPRPHGDARGQARPHEPRQRLLLRRGRGDPAPRRRRGRLRGAPPAGEARPRPRLRAGGVARLRPRPRGAYRRGDRGPGRGPAALPRPARARPRAAGVRLPVTTVSQRERGQGEAPPAADAGRPLDVVVVTTMFPTPAETFASARVRSLLEAGHRVRVASFKAPADGWERLVAE